jgi:hypothetical protein
LTGVVLWLAKPAHVELATPANPDPAPISAAVEAAPQIEKSVQNAAIVQPTIQPFNWSQLESSDYRTYVANLRSIGCPEQTIRDIVAADLDNAYYAPRRQALAQSAAAAGVIDTTLPDPVVNEMQQLGNQESSLVAQLLASKAAATQASTAGAVASDAFAPIVSPILPGMPTAAQKAPANSTTEPVSTPAASVAPSQPSLGNGLANSPAQLPISTSPVAVAAGSSIGNDAAQSTPPVTSAPSTDPTSALVSKWDLARRNADFSLRGLLGRQGYLDYMDQQYFDSTAVPQ